MTSIPPEANPRAALMAAIFLTLAGVYGVGQGVRTMSSPRVVNVAPETDPALSEAMHALQASPYSVALGASNIVVSVMLIIGSMMISNRRRSALWFVRQAIIANLLFILARAGVETYHVWSLGSALDPIAADAFARTREMFPEAEPPPDMTSVMRSGMLLTQLFGVLLSGSIHLYLGYKATRPAVQLFIEVGPPSRGP